MSLKLGKWGRPFRNLLSVKRRKFDFIAFSSRASCLDSQLSNFRHFYVKIKYFLWFFSISDLHVTAIMFLILANYSTNRSTGSKKRVNFYHSLKFYSEHVVSSTRKLSSRAVSTMSSTLSMAVAFHNHYRVKMLPI